MEFNAAAIGFGDGHQKIWQFKNRGQVLISYKTPRLFNLQKQQNWGQTKKAPSGVWESFGALHTVLLVQKCLNLSNPYPKVGFMLSISPPAPISC